jgi:hypothetical protein
MQPKCERSSRQLSPTYTTRATVLPVRGHPRLPFLWIATADSSPVRQPNWVPTRRTAGRELGPVRPQNAGRPAVSNIANPLGLCWSTAPAGQSEFEPSQLSTNRGGSFASRHETDDVTVQPRFKRIRDHLKDTSTAPHWTGGRSSPGGSSPFCWTNGQNETNKPLPQHEHAGGPLGSSRRGRAIRGQFNQGEPASDANEALTPTDTDPTPQSTTVLHLHYSAQATAVSKSMASYNGRPERD